MSRLRLGVDRAAVRDVAAEIEWAKSAASSAPVCPSFSTSASTSALWFAESPADVEHAKSLCRRAGRASALAIPRPAAPISCGRRDDPRWPGRAASAHDSDRCRRTRVMPVCGWPRAVIAINLTRACGTLAGAHLSRATTGTIRRALIAVPARVASSARRLTLHRPKNWPWHHALTTLFIRVCGPPRAAPS